MTGRRPKLLFYVQNDWFFCSHRLPIALAAKERGFDVSVATRVAKHGDVIRNAGLRLYPLQRMGGNGLDPIQESLTLLDILSVYVHEKPDLVHHVSIRPVLLGSVAARFARVPAVVNAVTGLGYLFLAEGRKASIARSVANRALRFGIHRPHQTAIFQNDDDRGDFERADIVDHERTVLIRGSGVDTDLFHPQPDDSNDVPMVVLGARMLRDKGVGELAEAARILKRRGVNCRIVLLGAPDPGNPTAIPEHELHRWVEEGVVEWWGHRDDLPEILPKADIACLPSYREGLPKFLLDAAASGLPIVTTDVPGCREVVEHGKNGLLVPAREAEPLADALQELIEDRGKRKLMGAASRSRAVNEFAIDQVVERTLEIYDRLLAELGMKLPGKP